MFQFFPITDDFLLRLGIKSADVHIRIVHYIEAFLVERNQIVDAVYLVQWKIWMNAMRPRSGRNEPSAADPAFEFVTV